MPATPSDIVQWTRCEEIMSAYNINYVIFTEYFKLLGRDDVILGTFVTVEQMYYFLLGYSGNIPKHLLQNKDSV